jgi:hypothetical protein
VAASISTVWQVIYWSRIRIKYQLTSSQSHRDSVLSRSLEILVKWQRNWGPQIGRFDKIPGSGVGRMSRIVKFWHVYTFLSPKLPGSRPKILKFTMICQLGFEKDVRHWESWPFS